MQAEKRDLHAISQERELAGPDTVFQSFPFPELPRRPLPGLIDGARSISRPSRSFTENVSGPFIPGYYQEIRDLTQYFQKRRHVMQINRPSITILACLLALSGCGQSSDEQAIEKSMGDSAGETASVDLSGNQIEISTEQGKINVASGEGVAVPAGFPKDIYLYEGARIMTSMTMPQGQMLTLETADPAARVDDAYDATMSAAGWKREMAMDSADGRMFSYAKDNRHAQVTIVADSDDAKTTITVIGGGEE
jgi:hypothetical protein